MSRQFQPADPTCNVIRFDADEVSTTPPAVIDPRFIWRQNPDFVAGEGAAVQAGLATVRESGRANMASMRAVQSVANDLECYALVVFCEDCIRARPRQDGARAWAAALRKLGEARGEGADDGEA
jgi:hypothetical protein